MCFLLDIKPENFLVDIIGVPKYADFGLARQLPPGESLWNKDYGGTKGYWSPEMRRGYHHTKTVFAIGDIAQRGLDHWGSTKVEQAQSQQTCEPHGLNTDVWSMGIVVHEIGQMLGFENDVKKTGRVCS